MAKKTNFQFLVWLLGLPLSVACSGSDGGSDSAFLESCSGSYVCFLAGESANAKLSKSNGRCYLGSMELRADGTSPPINGDRTVWAGDSNKLDICSGENCFSCFASGKSPVAAGNGPSASGRCTGSASSCSSVSSSGCTDQRGCHYTIGSDVSSTSDDGCAGTPRSCSEFENDAAGCSAQIGCTWR